jgi:hypothetical protein
MIYFSTPFPLNHTLLTETEIGHAVRGQSRFDSKSSLKNKKTPGLKPNHN